MRQVQLDHCCYPRLWGISVLTEIPDECLSSDRHVHDLRHIWRDFITTLMHDAWWQWDNDDDDEMMTMTMMMMTTKQWDGDNETMMTYDIDAWWQWDDDMTMTYDVDAWWRWDNDDDDDNEMMMTKQQQWWWNDETTTRWWCMTMMTRQWKRNNEMTMTRMRWRQQGWDDEMMMMSQWHKVSMFCLKLRCFAESCDILLKVATFCFKVATGSALTVLGTPPLKR
jgi:hypothetical protein